MSKGRKILKAAILSLVIMVMMISRVLVGSYSEHGKGEEFFGAKDYDRALIHFDRAVHWYTPLNPFVKGSVDRIYGIGLAYESLKENEKALNAYEILRSSIYSTRSFYTPYRYMIDKADEKIALLRSLGVGSSKGKAPGKEDVLKDLKKDRAPDVLYSILSIVGFIGWVACTLYFIFKIIGDGFPRKRAFIVGVTFFIFYILWVIGLAKA